MNSSFRIALLASTIFATSASAQTFNQFIVFGPSLLDSGYFKLNGGDLHFTAARNNGASMTPSGGIMNTDILAARFGLADISQGVSATGTNYAVSGARIASPNAFGFAAATPSITQQMTNYLASTGGVANSNALYVISAGSNDVGQPGVNLVQQAGIFSNAVTALRNAGARYILVPNLQRNDVLNTTIYQNLAAAGVNFIPADQVAMIQAVMANPVRFGLTSAARGPAPVGVTFPTPVPSSSACRPPQGGYSGYGLYCTPSTSPVGGVNGAAYLTSADALQTNLFSDNLHLSPAGQKIQADYYYSLIVAPSQISFLTESTIQARRGVTLGIQEQIDITQRRATPGFNVWFNGDVSSLKLNNSSPGFPGDPSTPISGTLGGSYTFSSNALIGAAVTLGQFDPTFTSGGGFRQQEVAATVFGAVRADSLWANAIMSFGWQKYDVNRVVPLGITFDSNSGNTHGRNFSFAALTGYDFRQGAITHGPVAGVEVQSVGIDAFTETGSFTSLAFSNIGRTSTVSALGYRAAVDYGNWRPFAQVTWNHEFDDTANRTVTASLTSITAPSYSMPIVQFGRDWASAVVGTTVTIARDWTGLAAFNAQFGQNGTTNYGGRFGINYAFNSAPTGLPVKAKY
ncbi:autotransporter domain-containing protein [Rhodopseudomonas boonkerdii]|uniref:autotransporter outer membrane beta-barrel domain-containing protein n=1 Tax=Rhodopseudomonas boonkerdii TaxID=475937 RepID=UPI001E637401|nr:autotransporter domain-containing protein [Rhodopseudomonas boonkerdii]UGV26312.1 autotransporter domain-containing protein [Rhodopseudomonas boonkerdii]